MTYPIYKGTRSAKAFRAVRANHSVSTRCTSAFCCTLYKLVGSSHSTEPSYTPANRARLRIEFMSRSLGIRGRFGITLPIHKATRLQQRAFGSNELHMCVQAHILGWALARGTPFEVHGSKNGKHLPPVRIEPH